MGLTNSKTYAEAVKVADHDAHQVDLSAGFHQPPSICDCFFGLNPVFFRSEVPLQEFQRRIHFFLAE